MTLSTILIATANATQEVAEKASNVKNFAEEFAGLSFDQILEKIITGTVDLAFKLFLAALVFYIGKLIINRIYKGVGTILVKRKVERSLSTFILSVMKAALLFVLIIIVVSILGIETSSFIALFASAGVAIGMALSGTLQNFAGGVLILLIKPYKIGDFIEAQGYTGTVKEIQLFNTILNTTDNKSVFIPNGGLSTGSIKNFSNEDYRRVDWVVNISYGNDYDVAKKAIMDIIHADNRIVKQYVEDDREMRKLQEGSKNEQKQETAQEEDTEKVKRGWLSKIFLPHKKIKFNEEEVKPAITMPKADCSPFIALNALSSSSVDIVVRAWTPTKFYWGVYFDVNEKIYKELPKAGISFPFPQMDVHITQ